MKQRILQTIHLMRQNPLHTVINVVGTAVTIAFVMVVVMMYDFRTVNMAPENDRDRMVYTRDGATHHITNTNFRSGMGPVAFEPLFDKLPGVEDVTWHGGLSNAICSLPASSERTKFMLRSVAANWFTFFDYDFVAGRPFTQEEYDAARNALERQTETNRRTLVVTERVARRFFGNAEEALGKEILVKFLPYRIVGVVNDVSSIFQTAYADMFQPFSLIKEYLPHEANGLSGVRKGVLKLQSGTSIPNVQNELQRREDILNNQGLEYVFTLGELYTHTDYTFFRDKGIDARLVYSLLIAILLIVPAISISGMHHAQMQSRLSEIAVRKAYGASNLSLMNNLFFESMLTTLLGGLVGYVLSCVLLWMGRIWLFGTGGTELSGIMVGSDMLLRPALFFATLLVCIVFNLLSACIPAWLAVHRTISDTIKGGE